MSNPAILRSIGIESEPLVFDLKIEQLIPDPSQAPREFTPETLARVTESLKTCGQLVPVRVRWDEPRFIHVIVGGELRWRAAKLAGLPTVPCVNPDEERELAERRWRHAIRSTAESMGNFRVPPGIYAQILLERRRSKAKDENAA